jgi:hypothetical protein
MKPKRALFVKVICLLCVCVEMSCRDTLRPIPAIVGTYSVLAANGLPLPAIIDEANGTTTMLVSGSLSVSAAGSYTSNNTDQITSSSGTVTKSTDSQGEYYPTESAYLFSEVGGSGVGLFFLVGDTLSGILYGVDYRLVRVAR